MVGCLPRVFFFFLKGVALLLRNVLAGAPFPPSPSCLLLLKLPKQRCNSWILTEHLSVSTRLQILKLPFWASTSIHYTPRHSCCAHLPLAAALSCDQPEPTVPFVDTSIVGAADGWSLKKKCSVSIAAHLSGLPSAHEQHGSFFFPFKLLQMEHL